VRKEATTPARWCAPCATYRAGERSPQSELASGADIRAAAFLIGFALASRRAAWNSNGSQAFADGTARTRDHQIMLSLPAGGNRKIVLFAAAILVAGTSISLAQGSGGTGGAGGGAGGARGGAAVPAGPPPTPSTSPSVVNPSNPGTVPQQSATPVNPSTPGTTPSTPTTTSGGGVTSPANDEATTARSERRSKARSVHHRWSRAAGGALGSYYCGSSPCFRIYPPAIYGYAAPAPVVVAPAYRVSSLWWPGYYDYAPGNWGRGHPRYGGYGRRAGYHGD
jgi:hypothetical protein